MTYWRRAILAHGCGTILTLGGLAHPLESLNRDHWVPLDSGEGDQTTDVATGAGGSMVYISGYKRAGQLGPDGSQNLQAILMAYNMSGVQQWVVEYGSDGDDEGNSVAADTTGVYLAGAVSVPSNNSGAAEDHDDTDAFVVKYNSTGGLLWETSWGTTELDLGNGVAVDAGSGLVYVVGTTRGSMPTGRDAAGEDDKVGDSGAAEASFESFAVNSGGSDVFLTCLGAADGDIQWTVQFGSAASDVGIRVAVGPRGGVFLIGQLGDDNDQKLAGARAFLAKYDYLGNAQFTARLNSSSTNFAVDLAPSSGSGGEGVVYMSGYTIGDSPEMFLARFEGSTGTQTWLSYLGEEPEVQLIAQAVAVVEGTHHGSDVGGGSDSAVSGSDATVGGNPVVEGDDIVDRGGDARVVVVGYNRSTASTMSHPSTGFTAVADTKGGWEWYTVSREAERETAIAVGAASGSGQSEGDSSVFIVGTVAASEASPGNYMFLDVQSVVREVQPTPPPSRQSKWTPGPTAAVEKVGGASATTGLSQNSSLWLLIIAPIFVVVGCILMTGYVSKQCAIAFGSQPDIPEEPMTPMEFSSHGDRDRDMRRLRDRRTLRPSGSSPSVRQDEVKMRSKSGRRGGEERAWTHSMMAVFREKGDRLPYRKLGEKSRSRLDRQGARELSLRDEEGDEWEGEIELGVTARPSPFDTPRGNGPASGNGLYSDGSNESRGVDGPVDAPHRLEQDPKEAEWTTSFENDDQVGYPKAISNTSGNPRDDEPQEVQPPRSAPFGSPGPSRLLHKAELL